MARNAHPLLPSRRTLTFPQQAGLANRLLGWLTRRARPPVRLAVLERVTLAPHHWLTLVEAEGPRFLVASGSNGGSCFHPLDSREAKPADRRSRRASW